MLTRRGICRRVAGWKDARKKLPSWALTRLDGVRIRALLVYRLRFTSSCNISSLVVIAREFA